MKNFFKFGFLALALSLTVVACNSEKTGESKDTVGTGMTTQNDTTIKTDTNRTDTVVKTDTTVVKSNM